MSDIANFNQRYLACLLATAYGDSQSASLQFNIELRAIRELMKLPSRSLKSIAQSPVLIASPAFQISDLRRVTFQERTEHIEDLNFDYLSTVRHIAATDIRLAMFVSKNSKEVCETILRMSMQDLRHASKANRLMCSCTISSKTLQRVDSVSTNLTESSFMMHLPMLAMPAISGAIA